ncbi:copper resistance protein CopC, partial [Arthrobacter livingstonensis]
MLGLVFLAAIMIPAAAAQAHDVLEATTPSDGST